LSTEGGSSAWIRSHSACPERPGGQERGAEVHDYLVLFAIVNAWGNLPVFADLVRGMAPAVRNRTFRIAVLTGLFIVMSFAWFGNWMLKSVFEVSIASFKIAGGILVFAVAAQGMLRGQRRLAPNQLRSDDVAVFPLGFPFLAGPGTIVTTILLMQTSGPLTTSVAAFLVYLTILPLLRVAPMIEKAVGRVVVLVVARILYIFICAKAVTFALDGLKSMLG
jgi:multiple antibiotic resistance protein